MTEAPRRRQVLAADPDTDPPADAEHKSIFSLDTLLTRMHAQTGV